jgi:3-hydroxybutyryl-CoA dehydrogenase
MKPATGGGTVTEIERVAVLGLGTMGHGIAQSFAMAGLAVACHDDDPRAIVSLHGRVRTNLLSFAEAGLVQARDIDAIIARLTLHESEASAVWDAQFVTEAIVEDLEIKRAFFARIEEMASDTAILASNSSSFPISASGTRLRRPERALVTHWFNPPHIIPAVEVVKGPSTSEETVNVTVGLLRRARKLPVRIDKELPGFLVNRVQIALQREVWDLVDRGVASIEDIDAAIRGSAGFRLAALGPLRISDFGGLDIHTTVFRNLAPEISASTEVPPAVQRIVNAGHYGFKTGEGFYSYSAEEAEAVRSERDRRFLQLLKLFYAEETAD